MPQFWSLCLVVVAAVILNLKTAATMASAGNWGEAIGSMFFSPIVVFLALQALLFYATRLVRGGQAVATFTTSRLNYVAGLITLLGVLGAAVNQV
ncbi:hypothetical protein [Mesorhizobium sp. 1M-11]|uniref:hypothetical protein n=1 Tax=Mesorhizobium sp. 1M-11 TaxID=1529006 RepID=UPI0006C7371C|nr:hypothetical protein [Mesorhizobium sp. 1M-11]